MTTLTIIACVIIIIGVPLFFIWLHNGIEEMKHHDYLIRRARVGHEWPDLEQWDIHHIYKSL